MGPKKPICAGICTASDWLCDLEQVILQSKLVFVFLKQGRSVYFYGRRKKSLLLIVMEEREIGVRMGASNREGSRWGGGGTTDDDDDLHDCFQESELVSCRNGHSADILSHFSLER